MLPSGHIIVNKFWKERFAYRANREFGLDKYSKTDVRALPTAEELRASLAATENAEVRNQLSALFDDSTFVETGVYTKRGFSDFLTTDKANELEAVITGYGSIDGKLVFVFAEDATRMGGVMDDRHAKKIEDLYALALKNGAPVIGIFNSNGTDIFAGTSSLAAYARVMKCITTASGRIPQIAYVAGKCLGTAAALAAMTDFVVKNAAAELYVTTPTITGVKDAQSNCVAFCAEEGQCLGFIRGLISFLPDNDAIGASVGQCADNLNRLLGDLDFAGEALSMIAAVADNGVYYEIGHDFAEEVSTVFTTVGGVRCGMVATSYAKGEGRLSADGAKKIARFVNFCDNFSVPVVTLVDSLGLKQDAANEPAFASALSDLAYAYAGCGSATVTVIVGHAIGAAFALLGSKALGADIVFATDNSEIGTLPAQSGVAFAWDHYITQEKTREDLVREWRENVSSPVAAASSGEIDDIIGVSELRARICSSLLMLTTQTPYQKMLSL